MSLDPFVTIAELNAWMQTSLEEDDPSALLALQIASDAIRDAIELTITEVEDDEITLIGNGRPSIVIPERPITAIDSLEIDGVALTENVDYTWTRSGILRHGRRCGSGVWPCGAVIVVTCTHGYPQDAIPGELKELVLNRATRSFDTADGGGVKSETIGRYSVTYGDAEGATAGRFTDGELAVLASWRTPNA